MERGPGRRAGSGRLRELVRGTDPGACPGRRPLGVSARTGSGRERSGQGHVHLPPRTLHAAWTRGVTTDNLWATLTASGPPFERSAGDDLPAIALNMVASVDGATTLDGRVGRLTGPADQALLRCLREESDAVLVGAATVRAEGYSALLRPEARERRERERGSAEPLLCVVSRDARLDPASPA